MLLNPRDHSRILNATIDFILFTKRFSEQNQVTNMTNLIICFQATDILFLSQF